MSSHLRKSSDPSLSSSLLSFYDNVLQKSKPKAINSARKPTHFAPKPSFDPSSCRSFNVFSLHDSNIYKDSAKPVKNTLRRKMLKRTSREGARKSLKIESELLSGRREKPGYGQKMALVPTKSVILEGKGVLTTTGKRNAQQIAKALKRLDEMDLV